MAAIYYSSSVPRRTLWLIYLAGVVAILLPSWMGIARAYYGYTHFGPVAASAWSMPWLVLATIIFSIWLVVLILLVKRSHYAIILYRNGLRLGEVEPPGKQAIFLPWEKISGIAVEMIARGGNLPPEHRATLHIAEGRKVRLTEALSGDRSLPGLVGPRRIENLPELITRIKARLYPRRYPALKTALQNEKSITFGPVTLNHQHLILYTAHPILRYIEHLGKITLLWNEIQRVTIQSGDLVVEWFHSKRPHSLNIPISRIPNLELMLNLIDSSVY